MMATLVLMVGFIGLIEAVTISTNSMDHGRRQTLATQIINHEIEELYLSTWANISALPTDSTDIAIDSQFDDARRSLGDKPEEANSDKVVVRFSVARTVTNPSPPVTNIREVKFTVSWVVTTSRRDADGNPVKFTHTRASSAWYGKYGLHLSYRQS